MRKIITSATIWCAILLGFVTIPSAQFTAAQTSDAGPSVIAKSLGTIKAINGNSITLAPGTGPEIAVTVAANAKVARVNSGSKDLTPIQLSDLHVGDTVRVRGHASADGKSIDGLEVIVITQSAVAAATDQIRQDWQKRGTGGLVSAVDAAAGTVTISVTGFGGKKDTVVHTSKSTIIRRYSPDSVKFDDAKTSTLADIHPGDQLRARGERSADGLQLAADEIVSGSFRNIAGVVNSTDAGAGTVVVQDLVTKKPVTVKVTADSQLHKLPPEMAQRIAMRLKSSMPPGTPGASGSGAPPANATAPAGVPAGPQMANGTGGSGGPGMGGPSGGMRQGGAPDFQQMLSHMPPVAVADLHKGDAVLIVATEGNGTSSTAITLLSGVEPILQAAPSASQAMMLSPWSLGGAPGGDAQ
jgi:hypothetical protein